MPDPQYDIPDDPDVTPEENEPDADRRGTTPGYADFTEADLFDADLTVANRTRPIWWDPPGIFIT
ncbi:MAG: hypothetical protein R6U01_06165 [Halorubrum sp.]|uniref:hypothetical protein n=1 Tax=Halorubrum sp. TaxID=1879286 RepID=UPI003970FC81